MMYEVLKRPWNADVAREILLGELHQAIENVFSHHIRIERMMYFIESQIMVNADDNKNFIDTIDSHFPNLFINFFLNKHTEEDNKEQGSRKMFAEGVPYHDDNEYTNHKSMYENDIHPFYVDNDVLTRYHIPRMLNKFFMHNDGPDPTDFDVDDVSMKEAKANLEFNSSIALSKIAVAGNLYNSNKDCSPSTTRNRSSPKHMCTDLSSVWNERRRYIYSLVHCLVNRIKYLRDPIPDTIDHCPICFEFNNENERLGLPIVTHSLLGGDWKASFIPSSSEDFNDTSKIFNDYHAALKKHFISELANELPKSSGSAKQSKKSSPSGITQLEREALRASSVHDKNEDNEFLRELLDEFDFIGEMYGTNSSVVMSYEMNFGNPNPTFHDFVSKCHILDCLFYWNSIYDSEGLGGLHQRSEVGDNIERLELGKYLPFSPEATFHLAYFGMKHGSLFHICLYKIVKLVAIFQYKFNKLCNDVQKEFVSSGCTDYKYPGVFSGISDPNPLLCTNASESKFYLYYYFA